MLTSKKIRISLDVILLIFIFIGNSYSITPDEMIKATLDLVNINNDKVKVTIIAPHIDSKTIIYRFAKIIPGTYAIADYGRYVEEFEAYDKDGNKLNVKSLDLNSWEIENAVRLNSVSYYVNDTYDTETSGAFESQSKTIFSPAGTNILDENNFMLNMCGFVGYFEGYKDLHYEIEILHPEILYGATAMVDQDGGNSRDIFNVSRYAEMVDNPIMYSKADTTSFSVNGMEVLLSVYSPDNRNITAEAFAPEIRTMITAQRDFLGDLSRTKKYAILVYISDGSASNAKGFGALEHNTSTTAVFGESMKTQELIDVISHEFFHTVTPLNVHSKEIHDFDFYEPHMSAHLWMYEGITEYFAKLFQVNQGLMSEDEFYKVMAEKEKFSKMLYSDSLSFITMSKNVLDTNYKAQYPNVYMKGALMAMCIDILIRSNSDGERGILDLMTQLSEIYGPERPFDDSEIISKVTELTYPEVGDFIEQHIVNGKPVDYEIYLGKVGVKRTMVKLPEEIVFATSSVASIKIDTSKKIVVAQNVDSSNFMRSLGVKNGDILLSMNGVSFNPSSVLTILTMGYGIKEDSQVTMEVLRNGKKVSLAGKAKLNYKTGPGYEFTDNSRSKLKEAWLKN